MVGDDEVRVEGGGYTLPLQILCSKHPPTPSKVHPTYPSFFNNIGYHDNHVAVLFPNHLPEVIHGVCQRA